MGFKPRQRQKIWFSNVQKDVEKKAMGRPAWRRGREVNKSLCRLEKENHPPGHYKNPIICTKENPWDRKNRVAHVRHADLVDVGSYDDFSSCGDSYDRVRCLNCGEKFKIYIPN